MFKKSREQYLLKFNLITVDKNTLNFPFEENKKFYEVLFGAGNEKIAQRVIEDLDKIENYEIIEDPIIYNYLKEKKIAGFERLVTEKAVENSNVNAKANDEVKTPDEDPNNFEKVFEKKEEAHAAEIKQE